MSDVLIHYTANARDIIMNEEDYVSIIDKNRIISKIKVKDAAKKRVLIPELSINNYIYDKDLVKYGYSLGMDKDIFIYSFFGT
jgi:hypothetical protein